MKNKFKPIQVTANGENIQDERIFVSSRKLNSFLNMIKKHYKVSSIEMKPFYVN